MPVTLIDNKFTASVQEAIQFCRENSSRQNSTLFYAQTDCPLAYKEWMNSNRNNGFKNHFATRIKTTVDIDGHPLTPYEMFRAREEILRENNNVTNCPTCSSEVEVISSDEGTSFYKPIKK